MKRYILDLRSPTERVIDVILFWVRVIAVIFIAIMTYGFITGELPA